MDETAEIEANALRDVRNSATDHIMSFVHTPAVFEGDEREGRSHILSDDVKGRATTIVDFEKNKSAAERLANKVVTPTSSNMTLAYYLKIFYGLTRISDEFRPFEYRHIRSTRWNAIAGNRLYLDDAEEYEIQRSRGVNLEDLPRNLREVGQEINNVWRLHDSSLIWQLRQFGTPRNPDNYKLENTREIITELAQSVWIPRQGKLELPKEIKKDKNLNEKLQKLSNILPPIDRKLKAEDRLKLNKITPLSEYYMMRYMATWLNTQGYVEQALPIFVQEENRVAIGKININQIKTNIEFDEDIGRLITNEMYEEKTPIDEMFAFERVRTTYEYPANYPENHINEDGTILQPDPKNEQIQVTYGILQQLYAVMSPQQRKNFIIQTKQFVLDPIDKIGITRHVKGARGGFVVPLRVQSVYLPIGIKGDLTTAEAALVWIEESDDERQFQGELTVKLPLDLNKPQEKETISEGATLFIPGLTLLLAEKANDHALYDSYSGSETSQNRNLDRKTGFDYLASLAQETQRPGLVKEIAIENTVEVQEKAFDFIIKNGFEGIYQPISEKTARFIMSSEDGIITTLSLDPSVIGKQYKTSTLKTKLERSLGDETVAKMLGEQLEEIAFNTEIDGELATTAFAIESGLQMRKARRFGAKAFNALGYLVEEQMMQSAQQAVRTAQIAKSSDFDKMVAALIGSPKHPGIAVSHAALHYQKLLARMRSPVKNWNFVDKEQFESGTFLSLETYLDNPAKRAIFWLLNEKGYISIGNFEGTRPTFFEVPKSAFESLPKFVGLQNAFATVVIGYYRLMFAQIRQRLVFVRTGQEGAKSGPETIDLKMYWKELMKEAAKSPPDSAIFGTMLRFFTQAIPGSKPVIRIPTWMPVMPSDLREAEKIKSDSKMPLKYLKWAYGEDPVSLEAFAEVAAAYHSAKALSFFDDYPHMVERFVNAVSEDKGTPFLFAILLGQKTDAQFLGPNQTADIMSSIITTETQVQQDVEVDDIEASPVEEMGRKIEEIRERGMEQENEDEAPKRAALQMMLRDSQRKASEALENLEPRNREENIEAIFNLLLGLRADIEELEIPGAGDQWVEQINQLRENLNDDNFTIEQVRNELEQGYLPRSIQFGADEESANNA